ncbi:hypothetical protein [Pseudomonas syringae group genomosp. 3]|uniref:hypothetical protein n=1 Tax=Pseudomonas syringae group genomosp. 3 TaxID=251701 RepID=UPI0003A0A9F9|nr:hypothetical protein [Pseudomonas syringae group genomosp. 3]
MTWKDWVDLVSFVADVTSSIASGIAIGIFVFKRKEIASAFSLLFGYSHQLTLSEIKEKLELLNNFNAAESGNAQTISNIFHDLLGQIRGNDKLLILMDVQIKKLELVFDPPVGKAKPLTEEKKRALISELREKVRSLNVQNIDDISGSRP